MNEDTGEYTKPPEDVLRDMERMITLKVTSVQAILDTLHHLDAFWRRHASPTAHAELRTYCTAQGWSPVCGTHAFLDSIGLHALALRGAIDAATNHSTTDHAGGTTGAEYDKETT